MPHELGFWVASHNSLDACKAALAAFAVQCMAMAAFALRNRMICSNSMLMLYASSGWCAVCGDMRFWSSLTTDESRRVVRGVSRHVIAVRPLVKFIVGDVIALGIGCEPYAFDSISPNC